MTKNQWLNRMYKEAKQAARRYDVPVSLLLAQAALETGWGKSQLFQKYNNISGMKIGSGRGEWSGRSVNMQTGEYIGGQYTMIPDNFRVYDSVKQAFNDMAHRHTQRARLYLKDLPIFEAIRKVAGSGYATAPNYAATLQKIVEDNNLTTFDKKLKTERTFANISLLFGSIIIGHAIYKQVFK